MVMANFGFDGRTIRADGYTEWVPFCGSWVPCRVLGTALLSYARYGIVRNRPPAFQVHLGQEPLVASWRRPRRRGAPKRKKPFNNADNACKCHGGRGGCRVERLSRHPHCRWRRAKVTVSNCHLKEASVEQATTIGLDIAKHVFQAHGADAAGRMLFRKRLTRERSCSGSSQCNRPALLRWKPAPPTLCRAASRCLARDAKRVADQLNAGDRAPVGCRAP